jgi:putative DNA primase/helicase
VTAVLVHLQRGLFPRLSKGVVQTAVEAVCRDAEYHPVRQYLESLRGRPIDGTLDVWLERALGVEAETDAEKAYVRAVGRRWIISAVARIMAPGCKAEAVLILEGLQGRRKSTVFEVLAGDPSSSLITFPRSTAKT